MKKTATKHAHYVESLARAIATARPYYVDPEAKLAGGTSKTYAFPGRPGVYLILRRVALPHTDYTTRGVNTQTPLVLCVGKMTSKRAIRRRLQDHFGGKKFSYQGSQFRKFLFPGRQASRVSAQDPELSGSAATGDHGRWTVPLARDLHVFRVRRACRA